MKFSAVVATALAAVASATPTAFKRADCPQVDEIPNCGYNCILDAVLAVGCAVDDYPCMCSKFAQLRLAAATCVYENCGLDGAPAVLDAAQAVCDACA